MTPTAPARARSCVPSRRTRVVAAVLSGLLGLCVLTALPAAPASARSAGPATLARDTGDTPLAVSMSSITPSTVPRKGKVTVSGEITNRSDSTWTDLQVFMVMSSDPMTTSDELTAASASPETSYAGDRITSPGLYQEVPDLQPGESTYYSVSVPRRALPVSGPGVYWLGVHVLGTNEDGRIVGADGRARTFIASMAPRGPRATLSLVLPLRAPVLRTTDGRVTGVSAWGRRLDADGRLGRLLDLAETGSDVPVTWVADPAVLDAVRSLSEGNPGFDFSPTDSTGSPESGAPSASTSETPGPVEEGGEQSQDGTEQFGEIAAEAELAQSWLAEFGAAVKGQTVLSLPYGDVDPATLFRGAFDETYSRADELGNTVMDELGVSSTPVVAPPNGLFPNRGLDDLDPGRTLLLSEKAADTDSTMVQLRQGTTAVLSSDVARVGGPAPTAPRAALALRQRILAEAAVHALTGPEGQPLVVELPDRWNPGGRWRSSGFFPGLDVPWVKAVNLPFAVATSRTEDYPGSLTYPRRAKRRELPVSNVVAAQELDNTGTVMAELLARNDTIDNQVGRAAMLGASANARPAPARARAMVQRISRSMHRTLDGVYVEGSPLVTMSSESGNFQVTVVNSLDEPVTVGIDVTTGSEQLRIKAPDMVSLGPGQRASVRLAATSTGTGVHSVLIRPTTRDGRPLGRSTTVKVRSSQVGLVIWIIMGTGAVVFVAALATRILQRLRSRRDTEEPQLEDVPS